MNLPKASLPVIDLGRAPGGSFNAAQSTAAAREVDSACREIGFLVVKGHGVPRELVQQTFAAAHAFFDSPESQKQTCIATDGRVRGYTPMLRQQLARSLQNETPPDLFERFRMGPFDVPDDEYHQSRARGWFAPNLWPASASASAPASAPGFRETLQQYYRAMEQLSADLMKLFALALGLPGHYFSKAIDRHISSLCLNHYPALNVPPAPGQLRAGEHSDYGSLTIVAPTPAAGRLQVLTRSDGWAEVDPPEDHFVVNIGDLMAQWTNDRWVSTLHRVGNPPVGDSKSRRLSLVFFHQPNDDASIECIPSCLAAGQKPRYAPVTSGEHLRLKIGRHFTQQTLA